MKIHIALVIALLGIGTSTHPLFSNKTAQWTFIVYLRAHQNTWGQELNDLEEIASKGPDNVVIQFNDPNTGAMERHLFKNGKFKMDLPGASSLEHFCSWAQETYPAYYVSVALIDRSAEKNTPLIMKELASIKSGEWKKCELLILNGHLPNDVRTALNIKGLAHLVLSSEDGMPFSCFPSFLYAPSYEAICPSTDHVKNMIKSIGLQLASSFVRHSTISILDLDKIQGLNDHLEKLSILLSECLLLQENNTITATLQQCRTECHSLGEDTVDVEEFLRTLLKHLPQITFKDKTKSQRFREEVRDLLCDTLFLIHEVVVARWVSSLQPRTYGISLFFPTTPITQTPEEYKDTTWIEFLKLYYETIANASETKGL